VCSMLLEDLTATKRRMLEILADKKECEVSELAKLLGIKAATVKKYASELEKLGLATRIGNTVKITEQGLTLISKPEKPQEDRELHENMKAEKSHAIRVAAADTVEPFYFINKEGGLVPLRVSSLEQLAVVVVYGIVKPEELSYVVRNGYLVAWVRTALGNKELAEKLEGLRSMEDNQLAKEVAKILKEFI